MEQQMATITIWALVAAEVHIRSLAVPSRHRPLNGQVPACYRSRKGDRVVEVSLSPACKTLD